MPTSTPTIRVLAAVAVSLSLTVDRLNAEPLFGMTRHRWRPWKEDHDLAPQGRFFSTSDYGYTPGEPDHLNVDSWNHKRFTRGQETGEKPAGSLRRMFPERSWLSGPERTLFGLSFEKPFTGKRLPPWRPITIDRILICWGEHVPAPGSWGGIIITKEGEVKRLPIDTARRLYPYDKTEITFDPVTIEKLYFAKKGPESGFEDNLAEVNRLCVYLAERKLLTNNLVVWQPDFYACVHDPKRPGTIKKIFCMCEFFGSIPSFTVTSVWPRQEGVFTHVEPYLVHQAERIDPIDKDYEVTIASANGVDTLRYTLEFTIPERDEPVKVNVDATFRRSVEDSVSLAMESIGDLPAHTAIALSMRGDGAIYAPAFDGEKTVAFDAAKPLKLDTLAGEVRLTFDGAETLTVKKDETDYRAATKGMNLWERRDYKQTGDVVFKASSIGNELSLDISLPLFEKSRPDELKFEFYEASAGQGDDGIAPFKAEDLELVETIHCGDPNDPHKIYDVTNDPRLKIRRYRDMVRHLRPHSVNVDPIIERPEDGAVPIAEVNGQPCRIIGDTYGTYFRYELDTDFESGYYYLVVIEHVFDRTRRGSMEITDQWNFRFFTRAGLDTGTMDHDGRFRKECVLFEADQEFKPVPAQVIRRPFSIWFTNAMQWQGWIKGPGPAIKTIEIYKVKSMPRIHDLSPLLPPESQRRHVGYHTQYFRPDFYRVDNQLTGMDQVWANISVASVLYSGMVRPARFPDAGAFHPGSLDGYAKALELAEENGATLKTYLAQLLHWGYPQCRDAFGAYSESGYCTYNWDNIPLSPTKEERAIIAEALANSLPRLAKHRSMQVVCTADPPGVPFTLRNLEDFCRDTGHSVKPTPITDRDFLNAAAILDAGSRATQAWIKWVCERRRDLFVWLRNEIWKHRPGLTLMVNAGWTRGPVHPYWNNPPSFTLSKENLAKHGLDSFNDYLKMLGYDADLYEHADGIAFQLHAGWPAVALQGNNSRSIEILEGETHTFDKTGAPGPRAPDFSDEPWMKNIADSYKGGLNYSLSISSEESSKPWAGHTAHCFKNGTELRKSLIQAAVLNARFVDFETYAFPWSGRIAEIRQFAVPFRLLPFTKPEAFAGTLRNASDTLLIRKHGDRHALINAGGDPVEAVLELPEGRTKVTDLSSGVEVDDPVENDGGERVVEIGMEPYSLRVLTIN